MSEAKIIIDEEFKNLIDLTNPIPDEVVKGLEATIIRDGCLDPLKVWDKDGELLLLDGHHRYDICKKHKIEYQTSTIEIASREEAINWIIDNQLSRRNVNEAQRAYLLGKKYNLAKKAEGGDKKSDEYKKSLDHSDPVISTAQKFADKEGVSEPTVKRAGQYFQAIEDLKKDNSEFVNHALRDPKKIPKKAVIAIAKMESEARKKAIKEVEAGTFKLPKPQEPEPEPEVTTSIPANSPEACPETEQMDVNTKAALASSPEKQVAGHPVPTINEFLFTIVEYYMDKSPRGCCDAKNKKWEWTLGCKSCGEVLGSAPVRAYSKYKGVTEFETWMGMFLDDSKDSVHYREIKKAFKETGVKLEKIRDLIILMEAENPTPSEEAITPSSPPTCALAKEGAIGSLQSWKGSTGSPSASIPVPTRENRSHCHISTYRPPEKDLLPTVRPAPKEKRGAGNPKKPRLPWPTRPSWSLKRS
jgi:hypothetical protein